MADVFLSYKSEDRPRVKLLAAAMEDDGLSVWWDAHIRAGDGWRRQIQAELDAAKCVLVAWSKRSVGPEGQFVQDEATRALRRGVYLPVLLDRVDPPLGFGEVQAPALVGWKGDRSDPRYQEVLEAARSLVAGVPLARPRGPAPTGPAVGRRALVGGGIALGVAALGGAGWWAATRGPGASPTSIAVLPFANLSGDPAQDYFSDGLAEELRTMLARIAGLTVAARTSSELLRDVDAKEVAERLGVAHVLTGSVRKGESKIRVAAQLLDGRTGLEQWSERYDRLVGDVLTVQEGIARSVAAALSRTLGTAAAFLGGTRNPVAFDFYLRGMAGQGNVSEAQTRALIAAFDAAIEADPGFAAAHAERSMMLSNLVIWSSLEDLRPTLELAEAAALRAVELEPALPAAHLALGSARDFGVQLQAADDSFNRVLALPGVGSRELDEIGLFNILMGRGESGLALVDRAIVLDPLNPERQKGRCYALRLLRRYDEALAAMDRFDAENPTDPILPASRGLVLLGAGRPADALAAFAKGAPDWRRFRGEAVTHAILGDRAASDRALAAMRADVNLIAYQTAEVYAVQGERERALAELEVALKIPDPGLSGLRMSPFLDPLRGDSRFADIERRAGFPAV